MPSACLLLREGQVPGSALPLTPTQWYGVLLPVAALSLSAAAVVNDDSGHHNQYTHRTRIARTVVWNSSEHFYEFNIKRNRNWAEKFAINPTECDIHALIYCLMTSTWRSNLELAISKAWSSCSHRLSGYSCLHWFDQSWEFFRLQWLEWEAAIVASSTSCLPSTFSSG